jgi:neutral ceramidase
MRALFRILAVFAAVSGTAGVVQAQKTTLRAGAFSQDVTPDKYPISVNGGFADRKATSAHDPLHARCIVLDDGKTTIAIVVVDSCMIPRELLDAAKALAEKKTGIPAGNILVSATHTHTAPTVAGVFQSEPDEGYARLLIERIALGVEKAHSRLAPAKAAWAIGKEPRQVFNRRWRMKPGVINSDPFGGMTDRVKMNPPRASPDLLEPAGPIDPDVTVLSVRSLDDKPLALYANYSLHYVGDMPPLSADYFGVFAEVIARKLKAGPDFVGALSNGTSGNINNIDFKEPAANAKPGERSRQVAEAVADAAVKALDGAEHRADLRLAVANRRLELPVRKPAAEEIRRAKVILEKAKGRELRGPEEVYARETTLLASYPDTVELQLQVMRVGDLAIAAIPCEVFVEIGLATKKVSPFKPTCVVSLANGYNGYLPTPEHHALGGYETWRARSSYLGVKSSETIEKALGEMLTKLAAK